MSDDGAALLALPHLWLVRPGGARAVCLDARWHRRLLAVPALYVRRHRYLGVVGVSLARGLLTAASALVWAVLLAGDSQLAAGWTVHVWSVGIGPLKLSCPHFGQFG